MTVVQVLLADRSYPIRIRPGSLQDLGEAVAKEIDVERAVAITTARVAGAHLERMREGFGRGRVRFDALTVPDGDDAKSLDVVSRLYDELCELGATRRTLLIGFGGGAVCDVTGFTASTYLRGVDLVQVPTTLLAQVDASVGGKTGIHLSRGRNLVGTFYHPRMVWIDPEVLASLPERERRCGLAEIVKVAAIWDAEFFAWLEEHVDAVLALEPEALSHAIARACAIKAEVVGLDEREAGLRSLLNFGESLGFSDAPGPPASGRAHGEAVAIGMALAARLSEKRGLAPAGTAERLIQLLHRVGLPTELEGELELPSGDVTLRPYVDAPEEGEGDEPDPLLGGRTRLVLLREIGRAEVVPLTSIEILSGIA